MSEYRDPRAGPRRRRRLIGGAVAVLSLAAISAAIVARSAARVTPPALQGAPLRVAAGGGDALLLLTSHEERRAVGSSRGGARRTRIERHLDLWRFDPQSAAPVWRRRLLTEVDARAPAALGARLLGAHGGTLWVHAGGPIAVAIADGRPIGDADSIEARSPALRGAMPTESRYFRMADDGLLIMATDASVHRVDPTTLAARLVPQPVTSPPTAASPAVTHPARWTPSSATAFATRGLQTPGRWLGVMTAEEGERFRSRVVAVTTALKGERRERAYHEASRLAPPRDGLDAPAWSRLWGARVKQVSAAPPDWPANLPDRWGTRAAYSEVASLPESPDFLQAGLLHAGDARAAPLLVREPDGVLVLHRDRLGEQGRLQLTRVAAPGGRPIWKASLPLSVLQAVLAGPTDRATLVLFGREYASRDGTGRDPYRDAHERVTSVDVVSGAVRAYDLTADGGGVPVTR